jgi:hypothetical protein
MMWTHTKTLMWQAVKLLHRIFFFFFFNIFYSAGGKVGDTDNTGNTCDTNIHYMRVHSYT